MASDLQSDPHDEGHAHDPFLKEELEARAPRLRALIHGRLPPRLNGILSVDDVMQEIWILAFRNYEGIRDDHPEAFDRWLTVIAQNVLINIIKAELCVRRGGKNVIAVNPARSQSYVDFAEHVLYEGRSPSGVVAVNEAATAIRIALAALPEDWREIVVLRFIENRSIGEVMKMTGRSESAVYSVSFRALRRLQALMGPASRYLTDAPSVEAPLNPARN